MLQLIKSNDAFLSPFKVFPLVEELEEWPTSICPPRDKPVQGGHHSRQILHFSRILKWVQVIYGFDRIRIDLFSSVSYHVP